MLSPWFEHDDNALSSLSFYLYATKPLGAFAMVRQGAASTAETAFWMDDYEAYNVTSPTTALWSLL